ncbi:MAG: transcriptional regulator [Deltaproteobacteria bacterium]|nr:MAG: transcriptional regulator [Deltaproteobacteria bacterium]
MRSYKQFCGVAKALDVVGERWTLLLVRELMLGPRRYTDLLQALPGLTTNLLAARLKHLDDAGIIERRTLAPPAATQVYALTEMGRELESVVLALGAFGARYLTEPGDDTTNLRWAMVSMRRRWHGEGPGTLVFRSPERAFTVVLGDSLTVEDGEARDPDVRVEAEEHVLLAGVARGHDLPFTGDATIYDRWRQGLFS